MFAIIALAALGCGGTKGGQAAITCDAVGDNLVDITLAGKQDLSERDQATLTSQVILVRDDYVKTCKSDRWPEATRKCLIDATTRTEFDACNRALLPAAKPTGSGEPANR